MLRLISSCIALGSTALLAACQSASEPMPTGLLLGQVVDDSGHPIEATLTIADATFTTTAQGQFSISPTKSPVYRIEVAAEGHYPMRHTFSHAELSQNAQLEDIVLVAKKPGRTLFVFGGDAMIGRRFYRPFEGEPVLVSAETALADSKSLLAEMKPYLERADYASINLETPIFDSPPSEAAPKSVTFFSAPETLGALEWAGVDYVALGNNHTYDFLEPGLVITLEHLADSELDFSGAGLDESQALAAFRLKAEDTEYDFLSYVGWPAGPPTQSAEINKGGAALGTAANLLATTAKSIETGAAPILQFHGGLEYVEEPTLSVETKLKQAVDAGAALVVGHHPHVVQGLELYQGKLVAWSLGNFLFDQYFYSAQSAALLYVWMDGDEFHHAEAVPLYIKGYHPTPAVGPMRNMINRRLFDLSHKRDTHLQRSGGHMILSHTNDSERAPPTFDVSSDSQNGKKRIGYDLLSRGDFDAHDLFDAPDRSWLDLDERITIRPNPTDPANKIMQIDLAANESITTGMRKFQRVYTPGTPMSVRANLVSTNSAIVDVYLQVRATGQSLDDALQNGRKVLVGSVSVEKGTLTPLDLDFDSPRTRARSLRILFEVRSGAKDVQLSVDNYQLIEWKTAFDTHTNDCALDLR